MHPFEAFFSMDTSDLAKLAEWMNRIIRGWMNYYGKF